MRYPLLFILFFPFVLQSQTSLNKIFNLPGMATTSIQALLIDQDTIVTFGSAIDVPGHYGVQFSKYDSLGELLDFKAYFHPDGKPYVLSNSTGFIKTSDGGYIGVGDINLGETVVVFKFTHTGDLEWRKGITFNNLRVIYANDLVECDGGYMLAGFLQYLDYDINGFVCKIDPGGNVLWRKDYGVPGLTDVSPFIRKKDDNTFFVSGGQNNGLGLGAPGFWMRSWVFQIDSTGSVLADWKSEIAENIGNCKTELTGGHELVLITSRLYANPPNAAKLAHTARKLDTNDWHTVWQTSQTLPVMSYLVGWWDLEQSLSDGGMDLVGTFHYEPNGAVLGGLSAHINPDGERVWIRQDTVYRSPLLNANENYLVSMGHLSSGSIVAGGFVLSTESSLHQEAWLLKLSPDGCLEPGDCAIVPTYESPLPTISSYLHWEVLPNPAKTYTLLVPDGDLQGKSGKITLYSLQGNLVQESVFSIQSRSAIRVDLLDLPPGTYLYQVQVGGEKVGAGKILVIW